MANKVAVIGLDCGEPSLVFDRWRQDLPNLDALMRRGLWGKLRSTDPPITVPAWSCMVTGHDPGSLGIYGFRNRREYSYDKLSVADSSWVKPPRVWERLGDAGKRVIVMGVPQTYPPSPVNGELITSFLTPDPRRDQFTSPDSLRHEIESLVGSYQVDVRNFRSDDRDRILAELYEMTGQHFKVARHLLDTRDWDFFMSVEMGTDRIHHAFWSFLDPDHPRHEPGHRYAEVIHEYYRYLDDEIGELLARFDDNTLVLVVSDHGAQAMHGAVAINEWLIQNGYLFLNEEPSKTTPLRGDMVDWSRTRAWGEGGYYCRLCCNVRGREPNGIVDPDDYEALRTALIAQLEHLPGPDGASIGTRVYRPKDLWPVQNGIPPDLIVYFGNLSWRSNGTVGHGHIYTFENDTGPDDANHSRYGLCIAAGPGIVTQADETQGLSIYDITPTILNAFGQGVPNDLNGTVIS